jgi:dolichol kinase
MSSIKLRTKKDLHFLRKIWHTSTGCIGLYAVLRSNRPPQDFGLILILIGSLGLVLDWIRLKNPTINKKLLKVYHPFIRQSEVTSVTGLPYYAFGTGLSLILFPFPIALLSCLYLIFCDPISSITGNLFGKNKIYKNKTLEGFLGNFVCAVIITFGHGLFYKMQTVDLLSWVLIGGILSATVELFSGRVDDNFAIPVFSGLGLYFFNQVFNFI